MSRIVQAVNAMIENKSKISDVLEAGPELLFSYKGSYVWGILNYPQTSSYQLFFYPGWSETGPLRDEMSLNGDVKMVSYSDQEIGTKEAKSSFAALYQVVSEKIHGVDKVLDEIIMDVFDPFED